MVTQLLDRIGRRKELILLGDFNAHTGSSVYNDVVGPYGEQTLNNNGSRLVEICQQNLLKILNGFYQHKAIHKFTCIQPTLQLKSIIDYIIIKQKTKLKCHDVRVLRGAECGTDHYLVRAKIFSLELLEV